MGRIARQITIEGRNIVRDALGTHKVISVNISRNVEGDGRVREIEEMAKKNGVQVRWVDQKEIEKESESGKPQGVLAYMELPETPTLEEILIKKRDAFVVLLNRIDYEQNLGAILRSAWAAGVDAVIASPNGVHELTPVVAKVSQGAAAYVPLIGMSLFQAIDLLEKYAVKVVGGEVNMGDIYTKASLRGPVALLIGGEAAGISEPLTKRCNQFVHIPMKSGVASLNVSVATALIMFEKNRQEREG